MKKIFSALLIFSSTLIIGQEYVTDNITIDKKEIVKFLDLINKVGQGISTAEAINYAKIALKTNHYLEYGYDGDATLQEFNNGETKFVSNKSGRTVHIVENKRIGRYLGFNGIGGYFPMISISSAEDDMYKKDNVYEIELTLFFMRRNANNSKLIQIQDFFVESTQEYFLNKCTSGIQNWRIIKQVERGSTTIDDFYTFEVFGRELFNEEDKDDCLTKSVDCESCYIDFEYGIAKSSDEGYSHHFIIGASNKLKKALLKSKQEVKDALFDFQFKAKTDDKGKFTIDLRDINLYDLKAMINFFIEDVKERVNKNLDIGEISATFETLEGNQIAASYAMNNRNVVIKVDPEKWSKSSEQKKWYVIYHELGHDILNLKHGEGGKMMFNFADKDYSWEEFIEDKKYMLNSIRN